LDVDVVCANAQQQLSLNSAKDINIKAGYNGSLNESYHKTSSLSLAGLVGIGSLYTSTEDLEGRIKKTAVNSACLSFGLFSSLSQRSFSPISYVQIDLYT
jgi:hypothetical protein